MPIYKNTGTNIIPVVNTGGYEIPLPPGHRVTTYENYAGVSDLTKITDEPYFNPVLAVTNVTATLQEITLNADTVAIEIVNNSALLVSMFWNAVANTPATPFMSGQYRKLNNVKEQGVKLIFTFTGVIAAGDFQVIEWRREI